MNKFANCNTDCDGEFLFPDLEIDQDCITYDEGFSQISDIVFRPNGAPDPFTDFTTIPTITAGAIDNSKTDNTACRHLVGEGGVAVPEKIVEDRPKRRSRITMRKYTLSFTVRNLSATQYNFFLKLQCGATNFTFYYADVDNKLLGKQGGIAPSSVDVEMPAGGGKDDKKIATVIITWEADSNPLMRESPL